MIRRRRRALAGIALTLVLSVMAWLTWPEPYPWPARLVIHPGADDATRRYSIHGRSYQSFGPAGLVEWDLATGQPRAIPTTPPLWRTGVSADGRRFVGWIGDDFGAAEVVMGDVATEAIDRRFPVRGEQGTNLTFRDGDRSIEVTLATRARAMSVATWDLASGVESRRAVAGPGPGHAGPLAYSPDGDVWAYLDRGRDAIQLWDARADRALGGPLRTPTTARNLAIWAWTGAAFTPDGRTLIVSRDDGRVECWSVPDGHLVRVVPALPGGYTAVDLRVTPDGRTLVASGTVFDAASGPSRLWKDAYYAAFKVYPGRDEWETAVLDLTTGRTLGRAHRSRFAGLAPDGRTVATRANDGTIAFRPIPPR